MMVNLLQFSLTLIIVYASLFIGYALSIIAKEEIKPGKKYFDALKKILMITIFFLPIILTKGNVWLVRVAIIGIGFTIGVHIIKMKFDLDMLYYPLFGILLALVANNKNILITQASLIFLYGLPVGSTLRKPNTKDLVKLSLYLVTALVTFQLI